MPSSFGKVVLQPELGDGAMATIVVFPTLALVGGVAGGAFGAEAHPSEHVSDPPMIKQIHADAGCLVNLGILIPNSHAATYGHFR
jgi:hypothetical protein